ncbi:uncharacterized protein LOC142323383 [Lycorma delicatula]|uniref:uncharacterized protein LOC142323383 n=1 Tax=Lycorma delicatula TaxID=130591 RepID=UPI003F518C92
MELLLLLMHTVTVFVLLKPGITEVEGLTCYQCIVHPQYNNHNETARLCSKFDASETFEVQCPYSTFCLKKTFELEIQNGKKIQLGIRDCAPQREKYQILRNGKWQMETTVDSNIYESGCHQEEDFGVKSSTAEYCYCSTNLCNGGESSRDPSSSIHHTDTMAVIFIFNAMKYIRSLR